jgi:dimethylaniline monooxygenase (N-oxide forming)
MAPRVLVIGAGCSGLVAIKECREEGLDVVCLEALPWVGGLWRFTDSESHSSVYRY